MRVLPWFQDRRPSQAGWDVFVDGELPVDLRQVQAGSLRVALQRQPGRVRPVGEQCRHRARHHLPVEEAARQWPFLQKYRGDSVPAAGKNKSLKNLLCLRGRVYGMIAYQSNVDGYGRSLLFYGDEGKKNITGNEMSS